MDQLSKRILKSKFFIIIIFTLLSINLLQAQCNVICSSAPNDNDFDALKELYCDTDGDNWKNNDGWYESLNEGAGCNYCEWYGVTCEDGRVIELDLGFNRLVGTIPSKISKLKKLKILRLGSNDISGTLPGSIGQLIELEELGLSGNEFHTPMPPQIGLLINLKSLNVDYAPFTGEIPEEIGNLVNLEYLNLVDNFFTSYPQSMGNLTKLKVIQMWDSFDDGLPFPDFLGNYQDLEGIRIAGDAMTGSFPIEILDFPKLRYVHFDDNVLSGELPHKVVNLDSLENFNISYNNFEGGFNLDFSECDKFRSLTISNNNFSGSFPEGLGDIPSFQSLRARNNNFSGCFPTDLYNKCGNTIDFNQNDAMSFYGEFMDFCFTDGTVDAQIGSSCDDGNGSQFLDFIDDNCECVSCEHPDMTSVVRLLSSSLHGWIHEGTNDDPDSETEGWAKDCDICNWYGITCNDDNRVIKIDLSANGLAQKISLGFDDLPFLEEIDLSNNELNGALPNLDLMDSLKSINLSNNSFYSTLPISWTEKPKLEFIDLHNNILTGAIPHEYGSIATLKHIDLSNNNLFGTIPFNAQANPNLEYINLFRNSFTGNLPPDIGDMMTLEYLNLSTNLFEGCIPESYRQLCTNGTLDLDFNKMLPWQGDTNQFCESKDLESQNGAHCGYNSAGYFEDCQCINIMPDCATAEDVLCKSWVQNFAQNLPCTDQNRYSISTSLYGNIPVILISQEISFVSKSFFTQYIFTCDGILLEDCYFEPASTCDYEESIYRQIKDNVVQIFHCQEDEFPSNCNNLCRHPDIPALVSFFGATDGENWLNNSGWTDGFNTPFCDPCDWFGVSCNDQERVESIQLIENNLSGNIPSALYNLEKLRTINLQNNQLSGCISAQIKNLTNLEYLDLATNSISGNIPKELHELPILYYIFLSKNQLTGDMPDFEMELPNLETYAAGENDLKSMPSSFENTPNLENLTLNENDIDGNLPSFLFQLEKLTWVLLSDNNLTGNLPEINSNNSLNLLLLGNNELSGSVPESFGLLSDLWFLSLRGNNLSGTLPESLENLDECLDIFLDQNNFSGPLPAFISDLETLLSADLSSNNFEGCIDSSYLSLCNYTSVDISDNPQLENDSWFSFCGMQEGICESAPPTTPYYPMAIEGANWVYKVKDDNNISYYGWRIEGDTSINNTSYKKGFRINADLLVAPPYQTLEYSIDPDNPVFYMRDDTTQKKVYVLYDELEDEYNCLPVTAGEEVLIFDFAPNINEDIYCTNGQQVVSTIDTLDYFDYTLPRYSINDGNRIQYQQIGDPQGLFLDINFAFVGTYSETLMEYCIRDEIGCYHDLGPLSTDDIRDNANVVLYPNPAMDKITISAPQKIVSAEIYSTDGRRIKSIQETGSMSLEIKFGKLSSQTLIALIRLEDGHLVRKLFTTY